MTVRPHPDWIADAPALRVALVDELVRAGAIRTDPVRAAFRSVPRELFVPEHAIRSGLPAVYENRVIVTKRSPFGVAISSSSQPQMMAAMIELLGAERGAHILEIGTGTGYNAALLSEIVGPTGRVVSVEVDAEVATRATTALGFGGYRVEVICTDGRRPLDIDTQFDGVIVTASSPSIHEHWIVPLTDGGRLVVPLRLNGGFAQVVSCFRRSGSSLVTETSVAGRFMNMRDAAEAVEHQTSELVVRDDDGWRVLVHLAGAGLDALDDEHRHRLAAVLREPPRRTVLDTEGPMWPLTTYLALELEPDRLVVRHPEISVGLVGPGGEGVALIEGRWSDGNRPEQPAIVAFGDRRTEVDLRRAVDGWIRRGRPDLTALEFGIEWHGDRAIPSPAWVDRA